MDEDLKFNSLPSDFLVRFFIFLNYILGSRILGTHVWLPRKCKPEIPRNRAVSHGTPLPPCCGQSGPVLGSVLEL